MIDHSFCDMIDCLGTMFSKPFAEINFTAHHVVEFQGIFMQDVWDSGEVAFAGESVRNQLCVLRDPKNISEDDDAFICRFWWRSEVDVDLDFC